MLPHYSPVKVAETFSILAALAPDRIDLGLGRAPGTDQLTALALQRDRRQPAPDDFPQQLVELLALLEDDMPADHPFARLAKVLPGLPERPSPWLLGSSPQSAIWAAELGLPYSFADFINPEGGAIAADYRARFSEQGRVSEPTVSVGVVALCADTDEEAERLAASHKMAFSLLRQGRLIKVPPVEQAVRYWESRGPRPPSRRRYIVGSPGEVRAGIEEVARDYQAQEVVILTIAYEHGARRRSYELLAREFGLGTPDAPLAETAERT
jgi:luciferase family oxidoreductase group 1